LFANKLFKIYISRLVGIFASILSYTIVIPRLSSNVSAYGIYSVVVSLLMLLQFADLGFLGAGQKYAAECFARNDREGEVKILSFVHFILFVIVVIYSFALFYVYITPSLVFNNLRADDVNLAKSLILIFITFSPVIVLQRFGSAIFSIRIEDYIGQFVDITASILKICSTFYFFKEEKYDIVGYIFFFQCMNLIAAIINLTVIKFRYHYQFLEVVRFFKFNKEVFQLTKKMAITSIVLTFTWILYYELDSVYVSKLYNPQTVALFAIGLTMLSFSRSLMNAFFSPFQTKFNHLRGLKDEKSLSGFFFRLIEWSFPISVIPPVVIILLMRPLIIAWLGPNYIDSIAISRILIINLFFSFLSVPISYLAIAREKFKFLLISSVSLPFFYMLFFFIFRERFDYLSLPIAKVLTIFVNLLINFYFIKDLITESFTKLLLTLARQIVIPFFLLAVLLFILKPFWNIEEGKSMASFFRIVSVGAISGMIPILAYYVMNPGTRIFVKNFLLKLRRA